jgi:hypothetical protein
MKMTPTLRLAAPTLPELSDYYCLRGRLINFFLGDTRLIIDALFLRGTLAYVTSRPPRRTPP